MAGYNRIIMMGNLTRDPEYKQLASGQSVCRLGLASNRQFKNRQTGDMIQEVCYIDIDVWGAQADSCNQYLQKGRPILVEGRIKFDTWEDPNGQTRSKHSIVADRVVFLSTPAESTTTVDGSVGQSTGQQGQTNQLDKKLMDQINELKSRTTTATQTKPKQEEPTVAPAQKIEEKKTTEQQSAQAGSKSPTGEIDFKDEPPFKDELPF